MVYASITEQTHNLKNRKNFQVATLQPSMQIILRRKYLRGLQKEEGFSIRFWKKQVKVVNATFLESL